MILQWTHSKIDFFIGLGGNFAPGWGINFRCQNNPFFRNPTRQRRKTIMRLVSCGYDNTLGYLKGGFEAWKNSGLEYDTVTSVTAEVLEEEMAKAIVFDVRKPGEYEAEHIVDVPSAPLDFLNEHLA